MDVSVGILYEVRGKDARKIMQELEHPTEEQLLKRQEIRKMVKEYAGIIKNPST